MLACLCIGVVLTLSLIIGGLVACNRQPAELRIGLVAYLSGEAKTVESSGQPTVEAAQLAVQEVNDAGGLDVGRRKYKVVLVIEDIESKPELAVNAAHKLIYQENVVAIVGPQYSRDAIPVARVAEEARLPMLSPMSTNPETTAGKQYVFRVGFVDDFQGRVMARFAREELGAQTTAVLYDVASAYNKGIAELFKQAFEEAGGQVVAFETYTTDNAEDFSQQLARIRESGAKVLFLPNYPQDVALQVQQANQMGVKAAIIGSDSWTPDSFADLPEFEGTFCSRHWHSDIANEQARSFIEAYRQVYDQDPNNTAALTYDAFGLLFQAIQSQGQVDPESIRNGLYNLGPYPGVSGSIEYQDTGDPVKSVVIVQIKDGDVVFYALVNP
jgi:branched-chain amino acid transport system substrate-binding protein